MSFFKQFRSIISKSPTEPQAIAHTGEQSAEPVERRSHKRLNSHKGRRVLIIDDSPTIVAVLKKILRSAGCITMEAFDAEHGLEILRQETPDLVFLDIVLPGMNGFAALRLMRRDSATQHIPVIMISGNEQATEQFYAKRIGADDFMKKPFSRFEVFGRMESLVELKKLASIHPTEPIIRPATATQAQDFAVAPNPPSTMHGTSAVGTPQVAPQLAQHVPPQTPAAPHAASHIAQPQPHTGSAQTINQPRPVTTQPTAPGAAAPVTLSAPAITPLEARAQLTAMGLQYFNQAQFLAARQRKDKLAIELFIAGGGVEVDV